MFDVIMEFRYKLRMLGVPVESKSILVSNNLSVVITTLPSSQSVEEEAPGM